MATSTLEAIRTKVRRLVRQPSTAQLADSDIDEYVNTFIAYDMPAHLKLFDLKTTLTFWTTPNQDQYSTIDVPSTDPLYNFKNVYTNIESPIYVDGNPIPLSQSRNEFFGWWPQVNVQQLLNPSGTATITGTINATPFLKGDVTIASTDSDGNKLVLHDVPYSPTNGNLVIPDVVAGGVFDPTNDVNYITGAFTATFSAIPGANNQIYSRTWQYAAAQPTAILYFDDMFTLRAVPDKVYPVTMDVYVRPTQLILSTDSPDIEQWWQYIAYGAAKKRLEDLSDIETIALILPEFKTQELLVNRKTIMQKSQERSATIFANQLKYSDGNWGRRYW